MYTLRRVTIGSAFRVMAILSGLLFTIFGFFLVFLPGLFGAGLLGLVASEMGRSAPLGIGVGFFGSLLAYLLGIIVYALAGGVIGLIYALLYNGVAGMVGGLDVELEPRE